MSHYSTTVINWCCTVNPMDASWVFLSKLIHHDSNYLTLALQKYNKCQMCTFLPCVTLLCSCCWNDPGRFPVAFTSFQHEESKEKVFRSPVTQEPRELGYGKETFYSGRKNIPIPCTLSRPHVLSRSTFSVFCPANGDEHTPPSSSLRFRTLKTKD